MDIIALARELGQKIQEDDRYVALIVATQVNDEDETLQALIGEFNLKRLSIANETSKAERDEAKIKSLNEELKNCYGAIMSNENMLKYNSAKAEFDSLMRRINAIIAGAANGENPRTVDLVETVCDGDCSGCSGCR